MSSIQYINSTVLDSTSSSVVFNNIPNSYNDLILSTSIIPNDTTNPALIVRVGNGSVDSSSSWYSFTALYATGSPGSNRLSGQNRFLFSREPGIGSITTTYFSGKIHFMSYSNSNMNKTVLAETGTANNGTSREIGLWQSTSIIDTVGLYVSVGAFGVKSCFTLWGVK